MSEEKTNKQVIEELQEYFLTQDPKVVARSLANMMIDMERIYYIESLDYEVANLLRYRIRMNVEQLRQFTDIGPKGDFKLINLGKDE